MRKFSQALIIIFILVSLGSTPASAATTSINDLIENAKALDAKEATIQGEVIGERMDRGDYTWINVNDKTNAIGIWVKKSEADKISYYGNYKYKGDTILVTGTFYRACDLHDGEADLHSNTLEITKSGYKVKEKISMEMLTIAFLLTLLAIPLLLWSLRIVKGKKINHE